MFGGTGRAQLQLSAAVGSADAKNNFELSPICTALVSVVRVPSKRQFGCFGDCGPREFSFFIPSDMCVEHVETFLSWQLLADQKRGRSWVGSGPETMRRLCGSTEGAAALL